ncbi:MAG: hypothetical protein ABSG59_14995 [Verrucomicrobiota bacterium]|jgi:hypothetical protein
MKTLPGTLLAAIGAAFVLLPPVFAESLFPPDWPAWKAPPPANGPAISNGVLEIIADLPNSRALEARVAGHSVAYVNLVSTIAYRKNGTVRLTDIPSGQCAATQNSFAFRSSWTDADGGRWNFNSRFTVYKNDLEADVEAVVDVDRDVFFLPLATVFAGQGSFGAAKGHGLFAGVEYLDNEPSSSELDLAGPQSQRQVPPAHDLTFPLMAIQADDRYVGLAWDDAQRFAGLFDSPDRIFGSSGHVMGVVWPATEDGGREPGRVFPKSPAVLKAMQPLRVHLWILAGVGDSVIPAVQQYVQLRGLPETPKAGDSYSSYIASAEAGWLKSKIRVGNLYRHALAEGNFAPGPASDAAVFETWLASRETNADTRRNLLENAREALAQVDPSAYYFSAPGHIHVPAASLLFGHLPEAIAAARADAAGQLARFDSEGRVIYHPAPGGVDFGKGHFAPDANGYTAATLIGALESAAFCGDGAMIDKAVAMLRRQDHFRGGSPRGVQVWELALHTPDIMASAYLARTYVDGYELTADPHFLDEAEYWAWSGMPFVYLRNPTGQAIGPYATIAVYGATHWQAPDWIGLPVQWCGLVYSDALYRLAAHDEKPWRQVADGITWSGALQSFPLTEPDHAGLLPDSFVLSAQHRNPPDINPATLGASAVRFYTGNTVYDFRGIPENGLLIHAPCRVRLEKSTAHRASFVLNPWETEPFSILINRLPATPRITVNNRPVDLALPNSYDAARGQLILRLRGKSRVTLNF